MISIGTINEYNIIFVYPLRLKRKENKNKMRQMKCFVQNKIASLLKNNSRIKNSMQKKKTKKN